MVMTDAQLVAIAITVLTVLCGTWINNTRLGDVKEVLRAEMQVLEGKMENRFSSMDRKLDEILRLMGDHETRLSALERPH